MTFDLVVAIEYCCIWILLGKYWFLQSS